MSGINKSKQKQERKENSNGLSVFDYVAAVTFNI